MNKPIKGVKKTSIIVEPYDSDPLKTRFPPPRRYCVCDGKVSKYPGPLEFILQEALTLKWEYWGSGIVVWQKGDIIKLRGQTGEASQREGRRYEYSDDDDGYTSELIEQLRQETQREWDKGKLGGADEPNRND